VKLELNKAKLEVSEAAQRSEKSSHELNIVRADLTTSEKTKDEMRTKATEVVKLYVVRRVDRE
jgi:hypothetical protein